MFKKISILIAIFFSPLCTGGTLESAINSIAGAIYKGAWPTATYSNYEIFETNHYQRYVIVSLNGISHFSEQKLYMRVKVFFTEDYGYKGIKVIHHNAILSPPFASVNALGDLLLELAENSNRSNSVNDGFGISVYNSCSRDAKFAIRYLSSDGDWRIERGFRIPSNDGGFLKSNGGRLMTNNTISFFYAKTVDDRTLWAGNDYFTYIDGERVGMRKFTDNSGVTDIKLSCPN